MVVAHTRSELKKIQSYQKQPLYLKTVTIRNYINRNKEYSIQKGAGNPNCKTNTYNVRGY